MVDVRGGHFFDELEKLLADLAHPVQILFLEANSATLVRRFKKAGAITPPHPRGQH